MSIERLRTAFGGTIVTPADPGYDTARSLWNGAIDRRPAVIARCTTAADVAAAVRFGRSQGLEIAVRGGGHSFAGHGCVDDGLMIDLSPMRSVTVDPVTKRARSGGGATWADHDAACQRHGLASPGGVVSHTGIGGLTLGGGFGWLSRKAGLSCDNLVSAQVVTADGSLVTASHSQNPDLHWALRGGGGNFGIVTEFELQLHDVGPIVHLGLFFWPASEGVSALRFGAEYVDALPRDLGAQLIGMNAPPAAFVPEEHIFQLGFGLMVVGFGSSREHQQAIEPVRKEGGAAFEHVTPIPYVELQKLIDESAPWGVLGYEKALYLDDLDDDAIEVIVEHLPRKASPGSIMPLFPLDGAYCDVGDEDSAWGGRRTKQWVVNIAAVSHDQGTFAMDRAWARDFYAALQKVAPTEGTYVNFLNDPGAADRIRASYGAKYDRLAKIKTAWDPENVFHLNANIEPSRAELGR